MTRMRVHELAKELNMEHKDLIDRIIKMGIQVKNHMSTLTDPAVQKIRQQFAEARAETFEEKRIGRAVIRRRKRTPEEELAAAEAGEAAVPFDAAVPATDAQLPEPPGGEDRGAEEVIEEMPAIEQPAAAPVDLPEAPVAPEVEIRAKGEKVPEMAVEAPPPPPAAAEETIEPVEAPSAPVTPVPVEPVSSTPQPETPPPPTPPAAPPSPAEPAPKRVEVRVEAPARAVIISKPERPVPPSPGRQAGRGPAAGRPARGAIDIEGRGLDRRRRGRGRQEQASSGQEEAAQEDQEG